MDDLYFNPASRYLLYAFTSFVIICMIAMIITIAVVIMYLRVWLAPYLAWNSYDLAGPICSSMNALQIQFFNIIFNKIAVKLNNLENHRTQSDYENSLIMKSYGFQFMNSFFSLFYIAFLKTWIRNPLYSIKTQRKRI